MALLEQVLGSLSIIFGVVIGESLALKVFGKVKNAFLNLINLVIFIVSLNWIFSQTKLINSLLPYLSYPFYFGFSFLLIFFIRGITTFGGTKGEKTLEEKIDETTDRIIKAMLKAGFSKKRIKEILEEVEFDENLIKNKLSKIKEEEYIPVTLKRLDKIESKLEKIAKNINKK